MATIDVEDTLSKLTLDEKVALAAGSDFWSTFAVPRLGIPSIRCSDGPNGVRGTRFFNSIPAACLPCGTALASTWDVNLIRQAGKLLGLEAKAKGSHIVLGPTINIQRSPLGGRGFESFSEDPILSGLLAAAYCNGLQEENIAATVKHFVCNDQEHERNAVDTIVTERALREIYLMPFMLAVRDAQPWSFMTGYNKINGVHCSEKSDLLEGIVRREWGWDGLIMSDWWGTYSTTEAVVAGLDLEMPGPARYRGGALTHAIKCRKLSVQSLDDRVRNVLSLVNKAAKAGIKADHVEKGRDCEQDRELMRKLAADAIVLLKNDECVLPLQKEKTTSIIGPNAKAAHICGGGSASLRPYYAISPYKGISSKCKDLRFAQGAYSHRELPVLGWQLKTAEGKQGVTFKAFNQPPEVQGRNCVEQFDIIDTAMFFQDYEPPDTTPTTFYAEIEGYLTPDEDGIWDFGLCVQGTARLFIDGLEIIDNATKQTPGDRFYSCGTVEEVGALSVKARHTYKLLVQFGNSSTSEFLTNKVGKGGVRLGGCQRITPEKAIESAAKLASEVEQVVLVTGLNDDWESEAHDRKHMDLPAHNDELISRVIEANPNTVVVVQSGTPVHMPWATKAKAILQCWYGGNEAGNAIADVLYGDVNPSGKLPLSFPCRLQDNPSYLNFGAENGRVLYGEDVYVGYRFYEKAERDVLFPFGHGLSYTAFDLSDLQLHVKNDFIHTSVKVKNIGGVSGAEVIQVYVAQKTPSIQRPKKELKGFGKAFLDPGKEKTVELSIPIKYATSFWDEDRSAWRSEADDYEVLVGTSSQGSFLRGSFSTANTVYWNGL